MIYRNFFLNVLLSMFCFMSYVSAGMMMPNMEDFEKELAEANRAIEEYVASLPPAEQAEFNRQVDEMSRMFENMSEEEFEKFLGEMFADESMMMEPNPFDEAIAQTPQEQVVEVVLSAEDKKKVETALAVLDDIIKQSNLFMVTVNSSSDLPERIDQWVKKDRIAHWQSGTDWIKFKVELESFIQKLYRAEEQDLNTKKYKYLFELIADESLYNNLIQLRSELKNTVSTIEIPEFSIQKLSAQTKKAIQNVLEKYAESFYLLGIPKALDTLFEKYAPEEEKIKAAEEAATKRAQEAARMTRTPAASTEAGSEAMDYGYGDYYGGGYDNYYPYGYDNYGGGYDNYSPYGYDNYGGGDYGYGSGSRSGGGSSSGGGSGSGRASSEGKELEEKEEKDKKEKDKKSKSEKFTPNFELDTAIRDIKKDLEEIKSTMTETEENPTLLVDLKKFVEHITNNEEKVDEILAGYVLPRVIDKKIDNLMVVLEKINKKDLNADDLAHYQKEVKKLFDEHKKELDNLVKTINSFEKKTEEEKKAAAEKVPAKPATEEENKKIDIETLPATKQWAYFGGNENLLTTDEDKKLTETITPVSLFTIRDKVIKLFKAVQEFQDKKAKAPRKPKPASSEMPSL